MRSSTAASSDAPAAGSWLSSCSIVRGPMIAELTAGWLTTKAMASSMSVTPASPATAASSSTASSLRWFSASDMSKRAASRWRAGDVGELSAVQLPDSQPPASGL
jgi:hypothetical protein